MFPLPLDSTGLQHHWSLFFSPNSQKYLAPDNPLGRLNYELIFDEARDGQELIDLFKNSK
jgi:hypothetical protein